MTTCCLFMLASLLTGTLSNSAEPPDQLILYSVDGRDDAGKPGKDVELFHNYPVLGKIEIKEAAKRDEILAALKSGIDKSDGTVAKCFWPRHGIRVVEKGKTTDYVICFECLQLKKHQEKDVKTIPITREPQAVLNKILREANIPLAPGIKE